MSAPAIYNQELFDLMSREHGLTLLQTELDEIENVVARQLEKNRQRDIEREKCPQIEAVMNLFR